MSRTKRPEIVTTPPLMVARECAAAALGISEGTLEALVRRGELPKPRKISAARVGLGDDAPRVTRPRPATSAR